MLDDIARDIRMLSNLWNKVIKASCYRGIRFGTEVILEDYNRIFPILETAETFFYIPRFLYFYRQRENSLVHSSTPEQQSHDRVVYARQPAVQQQLKENADKLRAGMEFKQTDENKSIVR